MNTRLIAIIIGLITPFLGHTQTYYSQYFDGADTSSLNSLIINIDTSSSNVWQIGTPSKTIFNSAATAPNAIVTDTINPYPINNVSSFSFGVDPQWFGWGILAFQWKQKLDIDNTGDIGMIEFSIDTGNTWQNAFNNPYVYNLYGFDPSNQGLSANGDIGFSGTDTNWRDIWLCLDASWLSFNDSLIFRFSLKSDSINNNKEGWIIDNLSHHLTLIHTLNEIKQKDYLKVYPTITNGKIDINARKSDQFHIIKNMQLINIQGEIVEEFGISPTKFSININHHPTGVYFLKVTTNFQTETFKIILQHE